MNLPTCSDPTDPPPLRPISSLDEAAAVLREMGRLRSRLKGLDLKTQRNMNLLRERSAARAAPLQQKLRILEGSLARFALKQLEHRLHKPRRVVCLHGLFGFRKSRELLPKDGENWETILDKLRTQQLWNAIRRKEEVNREAMRQWTPEQLGRVGLERMVREAFWYEVRDGDGPVQGASPTPGDA